MHISSISTIVFFPCAALAAKPLKKQAMVTNGWIENLCILENGDIGQKMSPILCYFVS